VNRGLGPLDLALCLAFALALPAGQVLFKLGAEQTRRIDGGLIAKVLFNPPLLGAFAWYGATSFLWVYILTRAPLSQVYPFSILGAALTPVLAVLLFRESLNFQGWLGYAVMLAGFVLVTRSAA
jgi:drug/metabolite transporter (DMT)-like permease